MANQILTEVWDHAPVMNASSFLVLLRMADVANYTHRMSWEAVDTIARHTRQSRRTVQRAIGELRDLGIIADVLEADKPGEARGIPSAVRWIRPVEDWGKVSTDDNLTPPSEPESDAPALPAETPGVATDSKVVTGDTVTPKPKNYLSTYGRESKNPSDSYRRAAARRPASPTRRKLRETQQAAEDSLDPAKSPEILELFGVPESAGEGSDGKARRRPGERRSRPVGPDSSMGLALAFRDAQAASDWRAIDMASLKPLAANFTRWKAQGISPDTIRTMIRIYAGDERIRTASKTKAPWLDFVGKKHLLLNQAERSVTAAQSADAWDRLAAAQEADPDNSGMWYVPGQTVEGVDK